MVLGERMRQKSSLWKQGGPALVFIGSVVLTIAVLYAVYGSTYFPKWPWFRVSLILSLITCLWPFALRKTKALGLLESVVYAWLILCFEVFLVYPGAKSLGLRSDFRLLPLVCVLSILQGVCTYLILRWIRDTEEN